MLLTGAIVREAESFSSELGEIADMFPGFSSRNWGLTLDTIIGLDVVLANGSHVHATNSSYPDTYWVSQYLSHTEFLC